MGKMKATLIDGGAAPATDAPNTGVADAPAAPAAEPALVVFGRDEANKAHASWFAAADANLAVKAAGMMGMRVLPVTTDEHRAAASALAAGRWPLAGSSTQVEASCRSPKRPPTRRYEG